MLRYLNRAPVAEQAAALGGGHLPPAAMKAMVDRTIKRLADRGHRLKRR
jgi:hypothetical protein